MNHDIKEPSEAAKVEHIIGKIAYEIVKFQDEHPFIIFSEQGIASIIRKHIDSACKAKDEEIARLNQFIDRAVELARNWDDSKGAWRLVSDLACLNQDYLANCN